MTEQCGNKTVLTVITYLFCIFVFLPTGMSDQIGVYTPDNFRIHNISQQDTYFRLISFSPEESIVVSHLEKKYEHKEWSDAKSNWINYYPENICRHLFSVTVYGTKNISMMGTIQCVTRPFNFVDLKTINEKDTVSYQLSNISYQGNTSTGTLEWFSSYPDIFNITINASNGIKSIQHSWIWIIDDVRLYNGTLPDTINRSILPYENGDNNTVNLNNSSFSFQSKDPEFQLVEKTMERYDGTSYLAHQFSGIVNRGENVSMGITIYSLLGNGTLLKMMAREIQTYNLSNDSTIGYYGNSWEQCGTYYIVLNASHQQETAVTSWIFTVREPEFKKNAPDNYLENGKQIYKKMLNFFSGER